MPICDFCGNIYTDLIIQSNYIRSNIYNYSLIPITIR